MNPAAILMLVQGIQAAISAAPQVEAIVVKAKDFIASLFEGGVITAAQQDAVHSHIDAVTAAFANGQVPPEFTVEPDPAS